MNVTDISIGIAAHPEGHPDIKDEVLINELIKKKDLADYVVTQMCFDANILGDWLIKIKNEGVDLPVWVGLPGVIERGTTFEDVFKNRCWRFITFSQKEDSSGS